MSNQYQKQKQKWKEQGREEAKQLIEDFIIKIEKHSVFTPYEQPIMNFCPSKIVWEKEFKEWARMRLSKQGSKR